MESNLKYEVLKTVNLIRVKNDMKSRIEEREFSSPTTGRTFSGWFRGDTCVGVHFNPNGLITVTSGTPSVRMTSIDYLELETVNG